MWIQPEVMQVYYSWTQTWCFTKYLTLFLDIESSMANLQGVGMKWGQWLHRIIDIDLWRLYICNQLDNVSCKLEQNDAVRQVWQRHKRYVEMQEMPIRELIVAVKGNERGQRGQKCTRNFEDCIVHAQLGKCSLECLARNGQAEHIAGRYFINNHGWACIEVGVKRSVPWNSRGYI